MFAKKTVGIMQPYAFPYLGYFHLVEASDEFVFLDDVSFIKQGWINRNQIRVNGRKHMFSIPLTSASPNVRIGEICLSGFQRFRTKFLKTLDAAYPRAPEYKQGKAYVDGVLSETQDSIADLAMTSIGHFYELIGRPRRFYTSSASFPATRFLQRTDRLTHIVRSLGGERYVNAPGGRCLYSAEDFARHGIELCFVRSQFRPYHQPGGRPFSAGLSIIDLVMNNSKKAIEMHLDSFELEETGTGSAQPGL